MESLDSGREIVLERIKDRRWSGDVVVTRVDLAPTPCADDPALWFAERTADAERAKALCQGCLLRVPCLDGALARREPWGVWGGEVVTDGVVLPTKRGRGRPPSASRQHARHTTVVRSADERPVR